MKRKYTIQINGTDPYPFDTFDDPKFDVQVKYVIPLPPLSQSQSFRKILQALFSLEHTNLIPILKINQIKDKEIKLCYEYVKNPLKNSKKSLEIATLANIKSKLFGLMEYLTNKNIKLTLRIQDIGITDEFEPKLFIKNDFQIIQNHDKSDQFSDYCNQLNRIFENNFGYKEQAKTLSQYSCILDKKLTELQNRINRMRKKSKGNLTDVNILKEDDSKNNSPSEASSHSKQKSSISSSNGFENTKLVSQNSLFFKAYHDNSLYYMNNPHKLTNSFVDSNKSPGRLRIHKSSFGDYTTTSHRLNQTLIKEVDLTHRVSNALEKTQAAFKNYERYSRRRIKL